MFLERLRIALRPVALLMVCLIPVMSGCGTLFTPRSLEMTISSRPSDAEVFIDNRPMGRTPVNYEAKGSRRERVRIEAPGYEVYEADIRTELNPITIINILFWPAFIVDLITGNFFRAVDINANLREADGGTRPAPRVASPRPAAPAPRVSGDQNAPFTPRRHELPAERPRIRAAMLTLQPMGAASIDNALTLTNFVEDEMFSQAARVYTFVERSEVERLTREINFQTSDAIDRNTAQQLGRGLGVQHLIVGRYTQSEDNTADSIQLRIIEVERFEIMAVKTSALTSVSQGRQQVIPAMVDELLGQMIERLTY
jgi:hypothetical protein